MYWNWYQDLTNSEEYHSMLAAVLSGTTWKKTFFHPLFKRLRTYFTSLFTFFFMYLYLSLSWFTVNTSYLIGFFLIRLSDGIPPHRFTVNTSHIRFFLIRLYDGIPPHNVMFFVFTQIAGLNRFNNILVCGSYSRFDWCSGLPCPVCLYCANCLRTQVIRKSSRECGLLSSLLKFYKKNCLE